MLDMGRESLLFSVFKRVGRSWAMIETNGEDSVRMFNHDPVAVWITISVLHITKQVCLAAEIAGFALDPKALEGDTSLTAASQNVSINPFGITNDDMPAQFFNPV